MSDGTAERARIRVLCVDDNELVLRAVSARLSREPDLRIVQSLENADTLVRVAKECLADIVLLDLDMPGRDPFEALVELQAERPEARVLVVTGHIRLELIDRALECGAWGYISKSAGPNQLVHAIRSVHSGNFVLGADIPADEHANSNSA